MCCIYKHGVLYYSMWNVIKYLRYVWSAGMWWYSCLSGCCCSSGSIFWVSLSQVYVVKLSNQILRGSIYTAYTIIFKYVFFLFFWCCFYGHLFVFVLSSINKLTFRFLLSSIVFFPYFPPFIIKFILNCLCAH